MYILPSFSTYETACLDFSKLECVIIEIIIQHQFFVILKGRRKRHALLLYRQLLLKFGLHCSALHFIEYKLIAVIASGRTCKRLLCLAYTSKQSPTQVTNYYFIIYLKFCSIFSPISAMRSIALLFTVVILNVLVQF